MASIEEACAILVFRCKDWGATRGSSVARGKGSIVGTVEDGLEAARAKR